jgi:hypothetical protein
MDPFRFKAVAPGAPARSLAPPQPAAASALDPRVMGREPRPHVTADRPGRVIPDDDERLLACVGQAGSQPPEILGGDVTDRPPVDNTEPPGLGVRPPHPIAGERWGGGIRRARRVLDQAHRSGVCPGLPVGVGQAAPPDVGGAPSHPGWRSWGESNQALPGVLLRASCGSGLVIQCGARVQDAPRRFMARRLVSSRRGRAVRPGSWHTWAARASVHRPVG